MHALHINYSYDSEIRDPEDLLHRYSLLHKSCIATLKAGVTRVTVIQRFSESIELTRDGIRYHFLNDNLGPVPKWWQHPVQTHALASRLSPDLIHIHGVAHFARTLRSAVGPNTPIVWQNRTPGNPGWRSQWLWKRALRSVDCALFTSADQSKRWLDLGLITPQHKVHEVLGGSTEFLPLPSHENRVKLGMEGQTVFLWVGRLISNKDPLTVLSGFREVRDKSDSAHLYMIYGTAELISDVQRKIRRLALDDSVHLLGRMAHERLPAYYSAADYFVLGSHQEECGLAVTEAIACGTTPVITDIPSFRRLTGGGRIGSLWRPGSARSFVAATTEAASRSLTRTEILRHFADHLSYRVMGKETLDAYSNAIAVHRGAR